MENIPEISLAWKIFIPFIVLFLVFLMAAWENVMSFLATLPGCLLEVMGAVQRRIARALPYLEKEFISKPRHL